MGTGRTIKGGSVRTDQCKTCGAEIFWADNMRTGKAMLFDAEPTPEPEDREKRRQLWVLDGVGARRARDGDGGPLYTVHWGTCPDTGEWKDTSRKDMRARGRI